jgi:hypothetical protein
MGTAAVERPPVTRRVVFRALAGVAESALAIVLVAQSSEIPSALTKVADVDMRWLAYRLFDRRPDVGPRRSLGHPPDGGRADPPQHPGGDVAHDRALPGQHRAAILLTAVGPIHLSTRAAMWPTTARYLGNTVLPARLGEVVRIVLIRVGRR